MLQLIGEVLVDQQAAGAQEIHLQLHRPKELMREQQQVTFQQEVTKEPLLVVVELQQHLLAHQVEELLQVEQVQQQVLIIVR
tara:strand:+ start:120 stop:365 length:246 start_codon:yes stop_codon:yes gene_type:complete